MTPGESSDRDVDNQIGQQTTGHAANPTQTGGARLRDEGIRAVPGTEGQASASATALASSCANDEADDRVAAMSGSRARSREAGVRRSSRRRISVSSLAQRDQPTRSAS